MKWLRVWWLIALLGLIILLLTYSGVYFFYSINNYVEKLFHNNIESLTAAQELRSAYRDFRFQLLRYQLDGKPSRLVEIERYKSKLVVNLALAEKAAVTLPEVVLTKKVRNGLQDLFDRFDQWKANGSPMPELLEINEMLDSVLVKEILEPNREYIQINATQLATLQRETQEFSTYVIRTFLIMGLLGILVGIGGGWLVNSWLVGYQNRIDTKLLSTSRILSHVGRQTAPDQLAKPLSSGELLDDVEGSALRAVELVRKSELDALRAEQLAKVGQLAAGIAHEIRNPLTSLKVLLQNLENRRGPSGKELTDKEWRIMEDEVERMETTLDGFLDFARPPRPVRHATDLRGVVRESLASVQARANLQGVKIQSPDPGEPIFAEIDRGQFRQVLSNLLINALDAQPMGGELRVTLSCTKNGKSNEVQLEVKDSGPGLPPNLGDAIFEPFTSTKDSGLGLGLSISRRIVEGHGGFLLGTNDPQGGAAFLVKIPVFKAPLKITG